MSQQGLEGGDTNSCFRHKYGKYIGESQQETINLRGNPFRVTEKFVSRCFNEKDFYGFEEGNLKGQ